jgi:NB-ARC domain
MKQYFEIPFDTNKRFVERPQILNSLESAMGLTGDVRRGKERVVLTGMGGSGKTELAIRFAELHRDDFWAIFWLDASRMTQFTNGLNSIANTLSSDCSVELNMALNYCREWFTAERDWLLIVDNLDDDEMIKMFRTVFLKAGMDGSILITSRNTSLNTIWDVIHVGDLTMQESRKLLRQILGTKMLTEEPAPDQTAEMDKLIKALGHLALAIDQAGSFIQQQHITVAEYLEYLSTETANLLSESSSRSLGNPEAAAVWTTWEISFRKVQENSCSASYLLLFLALLNYEDISVTILEAGCREQCHWSAAGEFNPAPVEERWVPATMSDVFSTHFALRRNLAALHKYSFIRWKIGDRAFSLHPLIQQWAYAKLLARPQDMEILRRCAIGIISSNFQKQDLLPPSAPPTDTLRLGEERTLSLWPWRKYPQLVGHAEKCLVYATEMTNMSEITCLQVLALLQTSDHVTAPDLGLNVLSSVGRSSAQLQPSRILKIKREDREFLNLSLQIWELIYTRTCGCRKFGRLCLKCKRKYACAASAYNSHRFLSVEPRVAIAFLNIWWIINLERFSQHIPDFLGVPTGRSWAERYGIAVSEYYGVLVARMAPTIGCDYRIPYTINWKTWDGDAATNSEPSGTFQKLCGADSEEYRRSIWHYTSSLVERNPRSREVVEILQPLVQQSIDHPNTSWSHERCIIRVVSCLLEMNANEKAKILLLQVKEAYAKEGLSLRSIQHSSLLKETTESSESAVSFLVMKLLNQR